MWRKTIGFLSLIVLLTGCASNQLNDRSLTNTGEKNKYRRITTSTTDENPNMIDLKKGNPAPTIGSDVNKAKGVVKSYKDYVPVSVWVNGNNMWVTAHTRERLSPHMRMKREAQLHKKLIQALPRYDINVKIEEK
ncbi:hypothetical protein ACQKP0_10575 [Heyndrickxia sp. NPDC080065]|uniref:hypothetical protein n=1 Tax=Heyndrickxia sp. NPDC080065 TaxID=3390568 RepID=UPI003D091662